MARGESSGIKAYSSSTCTALAKPYYLQIFTTSPLPDTKTNLSPNSGTIRFKGVWQQIIWSTLRCNFSSHPNIFRLTRFALSCSVSPPPFVNKLKGSLTVSLDYGRVNGLISRWVAQEEPAIGLPPRYKTPSMSDRIAGNLCLFIFKIFFIN